VRVERRRIEDIMIKRKVSMKEMGACSSVAGDVDKKFKKVYEAEEVMTTTLFVEVRAHEDYLLEFHTV